MTDPPPDPVPPPKAPPPSAPPADPPPDPQAPQFPSNQGGRLSRACTPKFIR